jgi:DNA-binding GntR family transcriptional regulator
MMTNPERRRAAQAYDDLLERILSGGLPPGAALNERTLATLLGMSRTPIRDALLMLETEGLAVRRGRGGLSVKEQRIEDFVDALDIRMLLEPEAAGVSTGRIDVRVLADIEAELRRLSADADASTGPDREAVRAVDDALHDAISAATGNSQLTELVRNLRRRTQIFDLKSLPERTVATCAEHLAIVHAIRGNDSQTAKNAMRIHLEAVRESIVLRLSKWAYAS